VGREREKDERDRRQAQERKEINERKVQRERDKQAHDAEKAAKLRKIGKRKLSQSTAPRKKQNRGGAGARSSPPAIEPLLAAVTETTRHGRTSTLPQRYV
jgi:hypothetical protein